MASYSAFFSSGLLAPRHEIHDLLKTPSKGQGLTPYGDSSPIRPASPLPSLVDDDSDNDSIMDVDHNGRESTPTQHSVSMAHTNSGPPKPTPAAGPALPRLRRRRSSLTVGTSPITSIRSPSRNVGVALQLQRHLAGGTRSRSGSVTAPVSPQEGFGMFSNVHGGPGAVATEGTSLMGRLRSGSMGSLGHAAPPPPKSIPGRTLRRHVRRVTSVPAPAPPPSAPLPDLPTTPFSGPFSQKGVARTPFSYQHNDAPGSAGFSAPTKGAFKGRDRGLSVCSSVDRIDEEMKEN